VAPALPHKILVANVAVLMDSLTPRPSDLLLWIINFISAITALLNKRHETVPYLTFDFIVISTVYIKEPK